MTHAPAMPIPGPDDGCPPAGAPGLHPSRRAVFPRAAAVLGDVLTAGPAAVRLAPRITRTRPWAGRDATEHGSRWPVLLLHGFAGTDRVWDPLAQELRAMGFGYVVRLSYNSFRSDPAEVVRAVHEQVAVALERTGAAGVHLVGHSLGGLFLRHAVQHDPSVAGPATVVLIATPHLGVRVARWVPGRCARLLHPAAPAVWDPPRADRSIRWITFSSDDDWLVPPSAARLRPWDSTVRNLHVAGAGHLTICRHPALVVRLVVELLRSEWRALGAATRPARAQAQQPFPGSVAGLVVPDVARRAKPVMDVDVARTPGAGPCPAHEAAGELEQEGPHDSDSRPW
ncbi:MAG: lpsA [Frankiales bacterium]|nr:lpsA [Frankiales bacterium]